MAHDNAPIEHTCKLIDSIISDIEDVRSANATLRDWGNKLYEENEGLTEKIEKLNSEICELKDMIKELERDLTYLVAENRDYESECQYLSEEVDRLSSNLF